MHQFLDRISALISHFFGLGACPRRHRCPVSRFVTVAGCWVGAMATILCPSVTEKGEARNSAAVKPPCRALMLQRAQLKGHYCISKPAAISLVTSKPMIFTRLHSSAVLFTSGCAPCCCSAGTPNSEPCYRNNLSSVETSIKIEMLT